MKWCLIIIKPDCLFHARASHSLTFKGSYNKYNFSQDVYTNRDYYKILLQILIKTKPEKVLTNFLAAYLQEKRILIYQNNWKQRFDLLIYYL